DAPESAFSALEARLSEGDRDLLAKVVFADELGEETRALDQALECLRTLENQNRDLHRTGLRDKIKSAERAGDMPEALRLMQQLNELSMKRLS
ncbi:MAG: hypothetical protein M3Y27_00640, partial [Acidobacteriota bacterium]|nr:hypothetical protein [Acidobacteriota bacterium]